MKNQTKIPKKIAFTIDVYNYVVCFVDCTQIKNCLEIVKLAEDALRDINIAVPKNFKSSFVKMLDEYFDENTGALCINRPDGFSFILLKQKVSKKDQLAFISHEIIHCIENIKSCCALPDFSEDTDEVYAYLMQNIFSKIVGLYLK